MRIKHGWLTAIGTIALALIAAITFSLNKQGKEPFIQVQDSGVVAIGGNNSGDINVNVGSSPEEFAEAVFAKIRGHLSDEQARQLAAKDQTIQELTRTIQALRDPDAPDRARRAEAMAALARGDTQKAEQLFADLERTAADKAKTADREASAQRKRAAAAARHRGILAYLHDTHGALAHYQRAAEYDPNDPIAWNRIGLLKQRLGELAEAQAAYQRVLAIGQQTNHQNAVAAALGNLGIIAQTRGELDQAEEYHQRSLTIDEELGNKEGMAADLGNLGNITQIRGELDQAEQYHRQALAINKELGHKEGMASQLGNLGLIAQIRGELEKAEEYHRRALAINKELGRKEGMASNLGNLGIIAGIRGELEQAEEYYRQALAINKELGRKAGMANQLGNLGLLAETRGQLDQAKARYREALALFQSLGARPQVELVSGWLQEVQEKLGRKQAER
uniref:Tfp pilus assembly protein PilF n=1 Tax=Candidatus Kentrum sp. MB TaxID=2138164 RepID=A0A450XXF4_9GAMM|nr:MAG: Tfp pilus assembly protein PilF [Candidatus Kentron sp. MB]VFK76520.1 MAG: Tfp pilus assembly protein PilF [Candidatus Kentron sp. MB]